MALDVKIKTLETLAYDINLGSITVFDCTGIYSTSNVGGWGSPNPVVGDVTKMELQFKDPDGIITTIEDTALILPNTDSIGFQVTADLLGLTKITSGIWEIEITYTIAAVEYCKKAFFLMKEEIVCCLDKRAVDYNVSDPFDENNIKTTNLRNLLCTATVNASIGQEETTRKIMNFLRANCEC